MTERLILSGFDCYCLVICHAVEEELNLSFSCKTVSYGNAPKKQTQQCLFWRTQVEKLLFVSIGRCPGVLNPESLLKLKLLISQSPVSMCDKLNPLLTNNKAKLVHSMGTGTHQRVISARGTMPGPSILVPPIKSNMNHTVGYL
ncbi:hypothetical protein GOODEAATRI_026427 [Goodea atripinnis]|uniref:Uncharacterized protein n=1 Tax=Goodea atripinnis TaxID=208336 RepID=A0ABV0N4J7_9TELE